MTTVILPVFNNFELAEECLRRLILYSGNKVKILVIDDASSDGAFEDYSAFSDFKQVHWLRNEKNIGFVGSVNRGFSICRGTDVALVNSDVFVSKDWLRIMTEELYKSSLYGTVTAMATQGSVATVKLENRNLKDLEPKDVDELNEWLAHQQHITNPIIPSAVGHCVLIKGSLTNLVGDLDTLFAPGYGEEVDFSLRANRYGFYHVLSSQVLVWHKNGASFGINNPIKKEHELLLNRKYPGYAELVRTYEERPELVSAVYMRILCQKYGLNLLIDGRPLAGGFTGTAKVIIEMYKKLREMSGVKNIDIILPEGTDKKSIKNSDHLNLISHVELVNKIRENGKYDAVFRPSQVNSYKTLKALWDWGQRVIILQLDYISYHNWHYHFSVQQYREFQDANLAALFLCDGIIFNSAFVYQESLRLGSQRLLGRDTAISNNGLDHVEENEFKKNKNSQVLILGTAFAHKNREYAIRLITKLRDKNSSIKFVFVGSEPDIGGSEINERELLKEINDLENCVRFMPWVDEESLEDIWASTDLVLYPSISEGFGLVPLEAARKGIPALYSNETSLVYSGEQPPFSISYRDIDLDVQTIETLVFDDLARQSQVEYLKHIGEQYTWDKSTRIVFEVIINAISSPPRIRKAHLERIFERSKRTESLRSVLARNRIVVRMFPIGSKRRKVMKKCYFLTPIFVREIKIPLSAKVV